jgi:hypothetical protein
MNEIQIKAVLVSQLCCLLSVYFQVPENTAGIRYHTEEQFHKLPLHALHFIG